MPPANRSGPGAATAGSMSSTRTRGSTPTTPRNRVRTPAGGVLSRSHFGAGSRATAPSAARRRRGAGRADRARVAVVTRGTRLRPTPSRLCYGAAMVRRDDDGSLGPRRVGTPVSRCVDPAGESPVPVSVGAPGSRPTRRKGEPPGPEAGRRKLLRGEPCRGTAPPARRRPLARWLRHVTSRDLVGEPRAGTCTHGSNEGLAHTRPSTAKG